MDKATNAERAAEVFTDECFAGRAFTKASATRAFNEAEWIRQAMALPAWKRIEELLERLLGSRRWTLLQSSDEDLGRLKSELRGFALLKSIVEERLFAGDMAKVWLAQQGREGAARVAIVPAPEMDTPVARAAQKQAREIDEFVKHPGGKALMRHLAEATWAHARMREMCSVADAVTHKAVIAAVNTALEDCFGALKTGVAADRQIAEQDTAKATGS